VFLDSVTELEVLVEHGAESERNGLGELVRVQNEDGETSF
jgi:hypothetical protein